MPGMTGASSTPRTSGSPEFAARLRRALDDRGASGRRSQRGTRLVTALPFPDRLRLALRQR